MGHPRPYSPCDTPDRVHDAESVQSVIDALPIPIYVTSLERSGIHLTAANVAATVASGVVGDSVELQDIFAEGSLEEMEYAIDRCQEKGGTLSLSCQRRLDFASECCSARLAKLDSGHVVIALISSDLDPNVAAGRDTLAAISHELRTPLNSIIGFAEMMSQEILGPLGSLQYREYTDLIGKAGRSILERFNQETERERLSAIRHQDDYEHIIELAPDMICICVGGRITKINAAGTAMLGMWDSDTLIDRPFSDFVPDDYKDIFTGDMEHLLNETSQVPVQLRRGDGATLDVEINVLRFNPRHEEEQGKRSVIIAARNVTERQRTIRTILEREERLRNTMDTVNDGIIVIDRTGAIESVNAAAVKAFGYAATELLNKSVSILLDESGEQNTTTTSERLLGCSENDGNRQFEAVGRRKDGRVFPLEVAVSAMTFGGHRLTIGSFRDISQRKAYESELERLATRDTLTGLPNRYRFEQELDAAIARADGKSSSFTLMSCDLNAFKSINDALGHVFGDKVLLAAAERIEQNLAGQGYLAHFGGDDFFVLFDSEVSRDTIEEIARRICEDMAKPLQVEDKEIFTSCTIGICVYPDDAGDRIELMQHADTVTHYAKKYFAGSYAFYTQPLSEQAQRRLDIERNLRRAIEREEFSILYQPKVDLSRRHVIGAEALIRWNSRELGFVPPDEFIIIAEQTGLIIDIGQWVLNQVCHEGADWLRTGLPPIHLGVNLSAIQFLHGDLEERIRRSLSDSGFEPQLLDLELTESMLVENPERTIDTLLELKKMGVTVSMDDFGTGYSALSYLTRFPLDTLKVDRAFVNNLPDDRDAATIARTIVSMAQQLNFAVVAEGIETESQMTFLNGLGCDIGQGYLFGKPMTPMDLREMVTTA